MSSVQLEIILDRENKVYCEGETLRGTVQLQCPSELKHDGIHLTLDGSVNLQMGNRKFGPLSDTSQQIPLINEVLELSLAGKLPVGLTELPFEFRLQHKNEQSKLYETYHGLFINITYQIRCDVKRSFLAKQLQKVQQICLQYKPEPPQGEPSPTEVEKTPVDFTISSDSLPAMSIKRTPTPPFLITGHFERTDLCITQPLRGYLSVQYTEEPIKSIELQLLRVESCGSEGSSTRDDSEIQTIQIVDGNVMPKLDICIYMIFPRLFTCPTLITRNFKIEFELNILVIFDDNYIVCKNFPIVLRRQQTRCDKL